MKNWELDFNRYEQLARRVAADGMVLLRNENRALPLEEGTKVALFGRMQNHYYRSGTGSGGMVNAPINVTIAEAFEQEKNITTDAELRAEYEAWEKENPYQLNKGWGAEHWSQEEMPLTKELAENYAAINDAAVVIIARTAGEDRDNSGEEGSFALRSSEEQMLETVCAAFSRVIVILNIGNVIDMKFIEKYKPQAVLLGWQGGMMGAYATLDVLTGRVNPSGCLADSVALEVTDYPSDKDFGDLQRDIYREDIYVGYRYFETFAKERVLYPFGFGLSYTEFDIKNDAVIYDGKKAVVKATVANSGDMAGAKVVQVYVEAPQGKLGKPARVLAGFKKTSVLAVGASETVEIEIDNKAMASFDDIGVICSGFVMEQGEYKLYVGANVRDAKEAGAFVLNEDVIVERLASAMKPAVAYERMKPMLVGEQKNIACNPDEEKMQENGCAKRSTAICADSGMNQYEIVWEKTPLRTGETVKKAAKEIPYAPGKVRNFSEVARGTATMEEFLAGVPNADLCSIARGEGMRSEKVTPGTASAFGGVNGHLKELGVPCGCCDDGPSGMRLDCGQKALSLPNGTMIACTFDPQLVEELYTMTGIEMRKNKVDVLLGPGMNIHRHPYNGRNFEYFSEDPLLTGKMAAAQIRALHSVGVDGTLKHFCGNNQETRRHSLDSVVSERALREIYLKGFEIAVKESDAHFVMTTYGRVNGMWTSNEYELTQVILREQWGFDGMVMTDWWAAINDTGREDAAGIPGNKTNFTRMVKARNDVYMCCPNSATNDHGDNLEENLANGTLTRAELAECAGHVLSTLLRLPTMERALGEEQKVTVTAQADYWDESKIETAATYEIGEDECTFSLEGVQSARGDSYAFGLNIKKPGGYEFELETQSGSALSIPLPATVLIGGEPIENITFWGVNGEIMTRTMKIVIDSETAVWRLFFSHDGLQVRKMTFRYVTDVETARKSGEYREAAM